jgi:MscS family membrane protein
MAFDFFYQRFFGNTLFEYFLAFGAILLFILLGKTFYYYSNSYFKKQADKTNTRYDNLIIDALEGPAVLLIISLGFLVGINILFIQEGIRNILINLVTVALVYSAVWALTRLVDILVGEYLMSLAKRTDTKLDNQLLPILKKGLKVIVLIVGILVILSRFGVDITAVLAGLGIGGLAIALAAKDTVENLFGAFAIFFDKPFKVGDRVVLGDRTGDVMEVGLRSTRIKTMDNTELYIPNSKVVTANVENISRPNRCLAYSMTLSLTYDTLPEKMKHAIELVKKILAETEGVSDKYTPTVVFRDFGPSSLDVFVKFWIRDYKERMIVVDRINQRVLEEFSKAKIEFAYPTQTVYVKK